MTTQQDNTVVIAKVTAERDALLDNLTKLTTFLNGDTVKELSTKMQSLLKIQQELMRGYGDVLQLRILTMQGVEEAAEYLPIATVSHMGEIVFDWLDKSVEEISNMHKIPVGTSVSVTHDESNEEVVPSIVLEGEKHHAFLAGLSTALSVFSHFPISRGVHPTVGKLEDVAAVAEEVVQVAAEITGK